MAANNNVQIIIKQKKEVKRGITNWLSIAEKQSLDFYKRSFTNEGFTDNSLKRWPRRKIQRSWPLLYKTGNLKNSLKIIIRGENYFVIGTDVSYAPYHNNGTDRLPQRQFIGESATLTRRLTNLLDDIIKKVFK
jgi:phage gpG-like protein